MIAINETTIEHNGTIYEFDETISGGYYAIGAKHSQHGRRTGYNQASKHLKRVFNFDKQDNPFYAVKY